MSDENAMAKLSDRKLRNMYLAVRREISRRVAILAQKERNMTREERVIRDAEERLLHAIFEEL